MPINRKYSKVNKINKKRVVNKPAKKTVGKPMPSSLKRKYNENDKEDVKKLRFIEELSQKLSQSSLSDTSDSDSDTSDSDSDSNCSGCDECELASDDEDNDSDNCFLDYNELDKKILELFNSVNVFDKLRVYKTLEKEIEKIKTK